MESTAYRRGIYEPIPIVIAGSQKPRMSRVNRRVLSLLIYRIPPFFAAFTFCALLGFGYLDFLFLHNNSPDLVFFPTKDISIVQVQKASLELEKEPLHPQEKIQDAVFTEHHIVRGETLSQIAYKYGLSPATLISVNQLNRPADLKEGRTLIVPYRDGIRVKLHNGDTIHQFALRMNIGNDSIQVLPNKDFFVSGIPPSEDIPVAFITEMFRYPVNGRIITPFGVSPDELTGISYESDGIDLEVSLNSPVEASRDGTVILTGHHPSYGLYIIVDHEGGWKSFYGYLGRIDVAPGDVVQAGTPLGVSGKSGSARTPRLHFVLIRNGELVDPLNYLY